MVILMPSCLAALVSERRCLTTVAKSVRHVVPTVLTDPQHAHVGVIEAVDRRPPDARFEDITQLALEQPDLTPKTGCSSTSSLDG